MEYREIAREYIEELGGRKNIANIVDCATRIRAEVNDVESIAPVERFKETGSINLAVHGNMVQVVVGLSAPQILESMREQLGSRIDTDALDEYGLTPDEERARILFESLGIPENINSVSVLGTDVVVQVSDMNWVDPFDIMLQLDIGIEGVRKVDNRVYITIPNPVLIAKELNMLVTKSKKQ